MCIVSVGLELSFVVFGGSTPPHLLEVCSAHKDRVEIKCMGSVGGKTPTEPKLYSFFSSLWHVEYDKVDVMCLVHSYNMDDVIRRMSMNVVFEYICQKEWSCLTYGRIDHLFIMYQTLQDYDYHLPKIRYATF